jgi:uncharacterized membrane protein
MAKIKRTIIINAPVEKVFDYIADSNNLPEFWPSMVEVKDVEKDKSFRWVYKMAGMRFEGSSEVIESIANERRVTKSTSGIPNTFMWTYQPEQGGTRLTLEIEYTVPIPLLGKLAEVFIVKMNEREADIMLANLKARMEM